MSEWSVTSGENTRQRAKVKKYEKGKFCELIKYFI